MILGFLKKKCVFRSMNKSCSDLFQTPSLGRYDQAAMEKCFARLFSTEDGQRALSYLQTITFMRAAAAEAEEGTLRHTEGQRALVATIMRLIARGQHHQS